MKHLRAIDPLSNKTHTSSSKHSLHTGSSEAHNSQPQSCGGFMYRTGLVTNKLLLQFDMLLL